MARLWPAHRTVTHIPTAQHRQTLSPHKAKPERPSNAHPHGPSHPPEHSPLPTCDPAINPAVDRGLRSRGEGADSFCPTAELPTEREAEGLLPAGGPPGQARGIQVAPGVGKLQVGWLLLEASLGCLRGPGPLCKQMSTGDAMGQSLPAQASLPACPGTPRGSTAGGLPASSPGARWHG